MSIYPFLEQIDAIFWGYIGFFLILLLGSYFTIKTRFFQIRAIPVIFRTLRDSCRSYQSTHIGVHPLRALFASVGSMVGIGNLVGIVTAVQIGGPGALFWTWVAALAGALIKYSEVYLGLKHRVQNNRGGYDGGPILFLRQAFSNQWVPFLVGLLLCLYGVEIYQFSVITDSIVANWDVPRIGVIAALLALVLFAGIGGVARIGKISSRLIPFFIASYLLMGSWVILHHLTEIPAMLGQVFLSAFTGQAAVGGFAGSTILLAIQHGIARAAYSADIGIGNDSVIQSESMVINPAIQGRLAICGVFMDNIVCTMSILIVLTTGVWSSSDSMMASSMIQEALGQHFPGMEIFIPLFLLILGYTTIIAYFCVGLKCAHILFPNKGRVGYCLYAALILPIFSYLEQSQALLMMSLSGSLLLIINLFGIFRLRKQVEFSLD